VAADGTIYAASNAGILHALDPVTGADRWTFDSGHRAAGNDLSTSPLVLPDGIVLWGASSNRLIALSPAGKMLWTQPLAGEATSPTSVDGHRVYIGDSSGAVTTLDVTRAKHQLAWTLRVGRSSYGSIVTDGTGRLYTTVDSALVAIDDHGQSGQVAWRADPGDGISEVSAGLAPDGTALLGTNGSREWAYRPDGTLRWGVTRVITYSSPTVTADGLVYLADHSGQLQVLRQTDGSRAADYRLDPPRQIWTSVAVDRAHRFYFGTQDGHVLGVAPDARVLFDIDLGAPIDCYPALTTDRTLIIGTRDGLLVTIR
jgi:outer membrane protein assembly factor BamB